jgi:hypothetical protein
MQRKKRNSMTLFAYYHEADKLKGAKFFSYMLQHPTLFTNERLATKFINSYLLRPELSSVIQTYTKQPYCRLLGHYLDDGQNGDTQTSNTLKKNLSNFLKLIIQPANKNPGLCYFFLYSLGSKDKFLDYFLHAINPADYPKHSASLKSQLEKVIKEKVRPDEISNLSIAAKVLLWKREGNEITHARGYTRSAVQAYNALAEEEEEVKYSFYTAFER